MFPAQPVIVAILGLGAAVGALASGGFGRRVLAIVAAVAGLGLPFAIGSGPAALRTLAALFALAVTIKGSDLVREHPSRPIGLRVAHVFCIHDLRLARFGAPELRLAQGLSGAAMAGITGVSLAGVLLWAPSSPAEDWARWAVALVPAWLGSEALDRLLMAGWALVGVRLRPVQNGPIRSRTVAEFWARRWNGVVRAWLATMALRPLARRGWPRTGVFASFLLSAAIHAFLAAPAVAWPYVAAMAAFFLLHGGIVELERRLGVARWPVAFAHAWTVGWFVLTGPLFLEPFLAVLGAATGFGQVDGIPGGAAIHGTL